MGSGGRKFPSGVQGQRQMLISSYDGDMSPMATPLCNCFIVLHSFSALYNVFIVV